MKSRKSVATFAPHEIQQFILPITLASVCIVAGVILEHLLNNNEVNIRLIFYGSVVILYSLINNALLVRTRNYREQYGLFNAVFAGVGLGLFNYIAPENVRETSHILIMLGIVAISIASGRLHSYLTMVLSAGVSSLLSRGSMTGLEPFLEWATPYIVGVVVIEAVARIKDTTRQHIHRLETINKISRQIMLSLDIHQTISLLNATLQEALEADSYFVGTVVGREIHLDLFYDDGEYFNNVHIPLEGTLSGWVIRNNRELFLPDLRENAELDGVDDFVIGRGRPNLSWMGVPLKASHITGIIALGSYRPNSFDSADLELLSNLAQHVSLALDNSLRHAQVEEQTRLDSLTGVFNHGYFLKVLAEQAEQAAASRSQLCLIMLDIDFFKQYNDRYGHLVGDRILKLLCTAIRHHVKQTDAIGRWGGEEFIISLPGAGPVDALRVAERIGQTMATLQVEDRDQKTIPVPTVSQGIAIYPNEADEIYRLVDLADRRLYIAKERGRNQVEPHPNQWEILN
ncbi:MAG TPA: sensor domain-containing diguanylate cyclase [Anaerolineales bacterium]|nr:sensor domain-containing diguanylate cyclase [Anaerolineales bacterium]